MKKIINSILVMAFFISVTASAQENRKNDLGQREGKWTGYYEGTNNLKYEGTFSNGVEQGEFIFYADEPGKVIIATRNFSQGNGNAYTVFYDGKGKKMTEGNFLNKKKEGKWITYHQGGKNIMSEEYYVNGELHGLKKVFYPDGKMSEEINYQNGIQNGYSYQYAENGVKLREEFYVNGAQHGKAVYRDGSGKVVSEGEYDNGKKIGPWAKKQAVKASVKK